MATPSAWMSPMSCGTNARAFRSATVEPARSPARRRMSASSRSRASRRSGSSTSACSIAKYGIASAYCCWAFSISRAA
ncbi:hypothetical protein WMF27_21320 [Sorangium sp. So ce281]|uniref:hypothetical protein n=1 Tax=Sorangium sp. So ce281 TaxID=3133293 RepID=UPI003F63D177